MRVLVVAGGTGGHIFPAISLADKIKKLNSSAEVAFCIDKRIDTGLLDASNYKYYLLQAPRMPYKFSLRWVPFLINVIFALFKSDKILNMADPDVVVGFGAYISGPILMQAKRQRRKVIIHEQNVAMGRANRVLLKWADKIALSFDNARYQKDARFILTGNLTREGLLQDLYNLDKETAVNLLELDSGKNTILVTGGSLGSDLINTVFLQTLNTLSDKVIDSLQIIHLTGKDKFANVQSAYKGIKVKVKLYPFFERMGLLYKAADFALSRAGASAITELCIFSLASILIPYMGAGAHQIENAKFLNEKGAAVLIKEKGLTPDVLKREVLSLINDKERRSAISRQAKLLAIRDAAEKLADAVLK